MKKRCIVLGNSPVFHKIDVESDDFIIACDGGYHSAMAFHLTPHLILGDFDSCTEAIDPTIKRIISPKEKDDTDTMLAIKYALSHGYQDIVLLGATGGRFDHHMANVQACAYVATHGALCTMIDQDNILYAIKDRVLTLSQRKNWSISIFSHTDVSIGVTLKGLAYPLQNATLTNTFPRGVSNEFLDDFATISVQSGVLLVVLSALQNENNNHL